MILSKENLVIENVTGKDKNIPVLDNVHIEEDGTTVASNGKVVLIAQPVKSHISKNVPVQKFDGFLTEPVSLARDTVKDIIKNIPKDSTFGGALEYCTIQNEGGQVIVHTHDGKSGKRIVGKVYPRPYVDYKKIVKHHGNPKNISNRMVFDSKRLTLLLVTLGKLSEEAPIYSEFTKNGDVLLRTVNQSTGQRFLAIVAGVQGKWLEYNSYEKALVSPVKKWRKKGWIRR